MKALESRYFEDLNIGDKSVSQGRTITETDIVNFAGLSGDYNSLHVDAEFASKSIAGQRLAHGLLVMAVASGLFTRTSYNLSLSESLLAFTEMKSWQFMKPVVIGDTIRVEVEVLEKIDTKPNRGKVIFKRTILNQRDELVQMGETVMLIAKRNKS